MARDPSSALPLNAGVFHILLALASGEQHGYSISKEVEASSNGAVRLGPTTLYRYLHQMHSDRWIEEIDDPHSSDPRRRLYRLTPWGRRIAEAEALRLIQVLRLAKTTNVLPAGSAL